MLPLLLPILTPIVSGLAALIPDPEARARAQAEAMQKALDAATAADAQQVETNKAEAGHGSVFVAGWRPAIGWVCAAALAYQYLLRPALAIGLDLRGIHAALPALDDNLWQLMLGMLGLGGLRTVEKLKGASAAPLAR